MTLDVGDVFSGYNYVLSGQKSHYYLVVHKTTQNQLIVVYFTTSLEKLIRLVGEMKPIWLQGKSLPLMLRLNQKTVPS